MDIYNLRIIRRIFISSNWGDYCLPYVYSLDSRAHITRFHFGGSTSMAS